MIPAVAARHAVASASLEWLLTDPMAFGLATATPLQRAICRIIDGRPLRELASHPDVIEALGGEAAVLALPSERHIRPARVVLLGGVRSGKSLITAAAAVRASQACDLSGLRHGEEARVSVLATDKDKADVVLNDHLTPTIRDKPMLATLLASEPTGDTLRLRHPTGRVVEVKVVAGKRAGGSVVSRWCAGLIADEAPRMVGHDEGIVNLDDTLKNVHSRLLPGAQIFEPGSPWGADGPVYRDFRDHFGAPSPDLVVIRCKGPAMNPSWWTAQRCEDTRRIDPDTYETDVLAHFLSPDEALLSHVAIAAATRAKPGDLPYDPAQSYVGAMDPATRGNAWTVTLATRVGQRKLVAYNREWVGSRAKPLNPDAVLAEIAADVKPYGVTTLGTDQWAVEALRDVAGRHDLSLVEMPFTRTDEGKLAKKIREAIVMGEIELPNDETFLSDMRRVRRQTSPGSAGFTVHLPKSSDGRHCDYWPPMLRCMSRYIDDEKPRSEDADAREQQRMRASAEKRYGARRDW